MRSKPLSALAVLGCLLLAPTTSSGAGDNAIDNLRAFARLYGYVKYFHPSDEAANVDWKRFAIHGVAKVKSARDIAELKSLLTELFGPLAPSLQIYADGDRPRKVRELFRQEGTGLEVVAWQHRGDGLDAASDATGRYQSFRMNKPHVSGASGTGEIAQWVSAGTCKGSSVRLRARLRIEKTRPEEDGRLFVKVVPAGQYDASEDLKAISIDAADWTPVELVAKVGEDAAYLVVGCALTGFGQLGADDFDVACQDDAGGWKPLDLDNPGFEQAAPEAELGEWAQAGEGYEATLDSQRPATGNTSLRLRYSGKIFDQAPAIGEVIDKELGPGLRCRAPVAVLSDGNTTLPAGNPRALERLRSELARIPLDTLQADDESLRLADVVIAWNVLQHFYPYFDIVSTDWAAALTEALRGALADRTEKDFYWTLRRMLSGLQDGHAGVRHALLKGWGDVPVLLDFVEGNVVVTATTEPETFHLGDVVLDIDGIPAQQLLRDRDATGSGSPQWRRIRALSRLTLGDLGTTAQVRLRRGDGELAVKSMRGRNELQYGLSEYRHEKIETLDDGIYYVDLQRTEMTELDARIEELAQANGVIFDLRGYPNGNHDIIRHLTDEPVQSARWNVPLVVYPDHERIVGFDTRGRWTLGPKAPRLRRRPVFLTDANAISYAETFLGIVAAYRLADIVGQTTAGTNGNVNRIELPGGFTVVWTGMKVLKHDGSQHHLVGIAPTVPVERTLKGVREGRDEFVEKALDHLRRQRGHHRAEDPEHTTEVPSSPL
ncbi:MAG: peptidase S41 [Candidatus Schekmanbacteria bacterium]|nr:peptidase S41 [Candidatus Schekmanbacteria bacterium]